MNDIRNFEYFLKNLSSNISDWEFLTDFKKVKKNIQKIENEILVLQKLNKSQNIDNDFKKMLIKNKDVIKIIPLMLAKRSDQEIKIYDEGNDFKYDFKLMKNSIDEYEKFFERTNLKEFLEKGYISNVKDYLYGVEVGLDSNSRKNRTGKAMENIVENFIQKAGFKKEKNYFSEKNTSYIKNNFGVDLSVINDNGKSEKRFDFIIYKNQIIYAIEVNYYSSSGSKLNETARSYKNIFEKTKNIKNFKFIWITDGQGWLSAKNNLAEVYNEGYAICNLYDLKKNFLNRILK